MSNGFATRHSSLVVTKMQDLKARTKKFAVDAVRFCGKLPQSQEYWVIGKQLMRCATSVGANYRAAARARSRADFIAKLFIVEEEADESCYWLELVQELTGQTLEELTRLHNEANQILAITIASKKTARANAEADKKL
jgi:four helix bundle protein